MCVFFVKFRPLPGSFVKKNHWIFNFLENFWFKAVSEWPTANNLVVIIFVNCYATLRILLKSHVAWKRIGSGWLYDYRKISYNYMKVQITEDKYFTLSFYTTCFMKSITIYNFCGFGQKNNISDREISCVWLDCRNPCCDAWDLWLIWLTSPVLDQVTLENLNFNSSDFFSC